MMTPMKQAALITIMDMIYDAQPEQISMRTLYSGVRRVLELNEFEEMLNEIVARGKAVASHNEDILKKRRYYKWVGGSLQ